MNFNEKKGQNYTREKNPKTPKRKAPIFLQWEWEKVEKHRNYPIGVSAKPTFPKGKHHFMASKLTSMTRDNPSFFSTEPPRADPFIKINRIIIKLFVHMGSPTRLWAVGPAKSPQAGANSDCWSATTSSCCNRLRPRDPLGMCCSYI